MRHVLANAEFAVMDRLWENGPMTARALREQLYPDAPRAQHGTIQRLLQRLEVKGFVSRDRTLSVHVFASTITREEYGGHQIESIAERLTNGSIVPLITHLVEHRRISPEEIERIRKIIDEDPDHEERQR